MENRIFPLVPSQPQWENIWTREVAAPLIPEKLDMRPQLLPVRDQKNTAMCAAFTACCLKEYEEWDNVQLKEYFSPEYLFSHKKSQGSSGMSLQSIVDVLMEKGCVRESYWVFGEKHPSLTPALLNEEAQKFKIKSYVRCTSVQETLAALVTSRGPVMIALPVFENAQQSSTTFWKPFSANDKALGGHGVCFVGFDQKEKFFWLRNSWGTHWGDQGYCKFPFDDFALIWDVFACDDDPSTHILTPPSFTKTKTKSACCNVQ
jgi:C1A family cysteine protease